MLIKLSAIVNGMTTIEQSYASTRLYPKLGVLAAGLFLVATNAFVIAGLLPDIAATLGVHTNEVSLSITYYSLVVAIAAPAISILLPRLPRTLLMVVGLLVFVLGGLITVFSDTLLLFTIGRIIAGLGGAAIVPTATAAAAALAPVQRRGRALAFVGIGFTLATAVGAPLGTALGSFGGWRLPLGILVGLAAVVAIVVALSVRGVPLAPPTSVGERFSILRDPRIVAPLMTTLFMIAGFNTFYIFTSTIAAEATGGNGALLAALLFSVGIAGVVGNSVSGPLTDRLGSRRTLGFSLGVMALVLLAIPFAEVSFVALAILFFVLGMVGFGAAVPVQHRLVSVDPARSALAMSWYTTAMYLGIAIAPILGGAASQIGGAHLIPIVAAVVIALAFAAFQLGYFARRAPRSGT
jgi:DHA1 family inner membrane transport protein